VNIVSKAQDNKKDYKDKKLLTAKEKRLAKQSKSSEKCISTLSKAGCLNSIIYPRSLYYGHLLYPDINSYLLD
jgi:hypothetical protein